MKVRSPLADMDINIGAVSRQGTQLKLTAARGSSIDADITVSASEALGIVGKLLSSGGGLSFVLGLPLFWLRERFGAASAGASPPTRAPPDAAPRADINKPW